MLATMIDQGAEKKLEKLVKLLSSSNDGEALAAVHAILRTLEGAGADIHELAARVGGGKLSKADMQRIYDAAYQNGKQAAERTQNTEFHNVGGPSWHDMAVECRDRDNGRLKPREREFVEDMVRWTTRQEPSEKQGKWLHILWVRVGKRR
jgi:hypothetical protein